VLNLNHYNLLMISGWHWLWQRANWHREGWEECILQRPLAQ